MTENDIERVAKAIYDTDDVWSTAFPFDAIADFDKNTYRTLARASIEATAPMYHDIARRATEIEGVNVWLLRALESVVDAIRRYETDVTGESEQPIAHRDMMDFADRAIEMARSVI